jgi:2-oxoglutarate dehydrogenase complex dehydrogenase (E1) component-like enzyme
MRDLRAAIESYADAEEIVWVQEEPENMGGWEFVRPHLIELSGGRPVHRVARARSASPAEGSATRHAVVQQAIVNEAFGARGQADAGVARKARRDSQLTSSKG